MGIKGFLQWMQLTFPTAFVEPSAQCDGLYFDMNGIVHDAARKGKDERHVLVRIFQRIDQTLRQCGPSKRIMLSLDGPGPLAKVKTQKLRRMKKEQSSSKKKKEPAVSSLAITVGTSFMNLVEDALYYLACKRLQTNSSVARTDIIVSGACVPGEGEVKIMRHVKEVLQTTNTPHSDRDVIVTADSDMLLLGLTIGHPNMRIDITREGLRICFSVSHMVEQLKRLFPFADPDRVRLDFVLLSFMHGNDYLPKMKGCGVSKLWRRYLNVQTKSNFAQKDDWYLLRKNSTFNAEFLIALLEPIARAQLAAQQHGSRFESSEEEEEEEEMEDEDASSDEDNDENGDDNVDDNMDTSDVEGVDNTAEVEGEVILMPDNKPLSRSCDMPEDGQTLNDIDTVMHDTIPDTTTTSHVTSKVPLNGIEKYLYGLLWCLRMYMDGVCPNYDFSCESVAPLPSAIVQLERSIIEGIYIDSHVSSTPALPVECALMMLPPKVFQYLASDLLPLPIQRLVNSNQQLADMMCTLDTPDKATLRTWVNSVNNLWTVNDDQRCRGFNPEYIVHRSNNEHQTFVSPVIPLGLDRLRPLPRLTTRISGGPLPPGKHFEPFTNKIPRLNYHSRADSIQLRHKPNSSHINNRPSNSHPSHRKLDGEGKRPLLLWNPPRMGSSAHRTPRSDHGRPDFMMNSTDRNDRERYNPMPYTTVSHHDNYHPQHTGLPQNGTNTNSGYHGSRPPRHHPTVNNSDPRQYSHQGNLPPRQYQTVNNSDPMQYGRHSNHHSLQYQPNSGPNPYYAPRHHSNQISTRHSSNRCSDHIRQGRHTHFSS